MDYERFRQVLAFTFRAEGGFSDDPNDAGGATNFGITRGTLVRAYKAGLVSHIDIKALTRPEAERIYYEFYWKLCHADELPDPLDMIIFDIAVNSGVGRGVMMLQDGINSMRKVNIAVDGGFGPITRAAVRDLLGTEVPGFLPMKVLLSQVVLLLRIEFYDDITDGVASSAKKRQQEILNRKFIRGWLRRSMDLLEKVE